MAHSSGRGRSNFIVGLVLIGLGALFLLGQVVHVGTLQLLLPFYFLLPGILFFVAMTLGGKTTGPLAIPGSIVTAAGLILLFQGLTGYYKSWWYAWALILPASAGIGLIIHGMYSNEPRLIHSGRRWLTTGLIVFLCFGAFFEILIFRSTAGSIVWPGLMIALGAYLLLRRGSQTTAPAARTEVISAPSTEVPARPSVSPRPIASAQPVPPALPQFEPIDKPRARRRSTSIQPKE
jgi:hypothetical protein